MIYGLVNPLRQEEHYFSHKVMYLKDKWLGNFSELLDRCPRTDYDRWLDRFDQFKEMWEETGFEEKLLNNPDLVHQTEEDFRKMYYAHDPVEITSIVDRMLKRLSRNYHIPFPNW